MSFSRTSLSHDDTNAWKYGTAFINFLTEVIHFSQAQESRGQSPNTTYVSKGEEFPYLRIKFCTGVWNFIPRYIFFTWVRNLVPWCIILWKFHGHIYFTFLRMYKWSTIQGNVPLYPCVKFCTWVHNFLLEYGVQLWVYSFVYYQCAWKWFGLFESWRPGVELVRRLLVCAKK
jgi:hypothetical protein